MTGDRKTNLPTAIDGEVLPPTEYRQQRPTGYVHNSVPDTTMRGVSAIFLRWGLHNIALAIDEQTAVETSMAKLHAARRSLAIVQGDSWDLDLIRENARKNQQARLDADAEARAIQKHQFEIAAFNRKMEMMAKKREVRVAEEIDKRDAVAKVADAKEKALLARKRLNAAGNITAAKIEEVVLEALHSRNVALKKEAGSDGEAQIVDAARKPQSHKSVTNDPDDDFTPEELTDGVIAEFELMEKQRGLAPHEQEVLNRLRAFINGRNQAQS